MHACDRCDPVMLLRQYRLNITTARKKILEIFLSYQRPLTKRELNQYCDQSIDRVTMYRVIDLFLKQNIIQSVPMGNRTGYVFLQQKNATGIMYFVCSMCNSSSATEIPAAAIFTDGHHITQMKILANGICDKCK